MVCNGTATSASTLFQFVDDFPRFYRLREFLASLFFSFLNPGLHGPHRFQKTRNRDLSTPAALESYRLSANVTAEAAALGEASVSAVTVV